MSEINSFTFLGYTFRRRWTRAKNGNFFNAFTPAVSKEAAKAFRAKIKNSRLYKGIGSLQGLANEINPIIRGWMNYFMAYGKREAIKSLDYINISIVRFVLRFYKKKGKTKKKAWHLVTIIARDNPDMFYHWKYGITVNA